MYRYDDFDTTPVERRVTQAEDLLRRIAARHVPAVFASSFGAEDMVLIDMIARHALPHSPPHDRHRPAARGNARADRTNPRTLRAPDRRLHARRAAAAGVRPRKRRQRLLPEHGLAQGLLRRAQDRAAEARAWWPRARGSPACAAPSRSRGRTSPLEEFDAVHGLAQVQSARRVERRRRLELPARP